MTKKKLKEFLIEQVIFHILVVLMFSVLYNFFNFPLQSLITGYMIHWFFRFIFLISKDEPSKDKTLKEYIEK